MENNDEAVSGKERNKKSWINPKEYIKQKEFMDETTDYEDGFSAEGRGSNLVGRSDLSAQEGHEKQNPLQIKVTEALKRGPEVDIQNVDITVRGQTVILSGEAEDPKTERALVDLASNIEGVEKVESKLRLKSG